LPAAALISAGGGLIVLSLAVVLWRRRVAARRGGPACPAGRSTERSGRPASVGASPASSGRLRAGLTKTRNGLLGRLAPLLGRGRLDAAALEEVEAALLAADVGVRMTERLVRSLREGRNGSAGAARDILERELITI